MQDGWVCFIAGVVFIVGMAWGYALYASDLRQSARAGVVVIDGSLYVLLPAKRGVD